MNSLWQAIDPGRAGIDNLAPAVWTPGGVMSYGEFSRAVSATRENLIQLGMTAQSRVLFVGDPSIETIACLVALISLDCTSVPVSPRYPAERLQADSEATDAAFLVASSRYWRSNSSSLPDFRPMGTPSPGLVLAIRLEPAGHPPLMGRGGEPIVFIGRTSGTTGAPKYLCLGARTKSLRLQSLVDTYGLAERCVLFASTPLHHTLTLRTLHAAMALGSTFALLDRFSPQRWTECIAGSSADFTTVVAAQARSILAMGPLGASNGIRLRTMVSSSAPLLEVEKSRFADSCDFDLHECYGTAETATATDLLATQQRGRLDTVGWPIRGVAIGIERGRENQAQLPEAGQILVRSEFAFDGYLRQSGWGVDVWEPLDQFATGDLGFLQADGALVFLGRQVERINVGGSNVFPSEIEGVAAQAPDVLEAAAVGIKHPVLGEVPWLFVKTSRKLEGTAWLASHLRRQLEDHQLPHRIVVVTEMPLTEGGKVDRHQLALSASEPSGAKSRAVSEEPISR